VSDINTALVDRLKALDPNRPIREADIALSTRMEATPGSDIVSVGFSYLTFGVVVGAK
jgi:hypothetical protein